MPDAKRLRNETELLDAAKWLEGKTLTEIEGLVVEEDLAERHKTKHTVGYVVEHGYFGIHKNSSGKADIEHLGIELKTNPLKWGKQKTRGKNEYRKKLSVKEPLSLNIINYIEEARNNDIRQSSLYKKNRKILFVFYIHEGAGKRSDYTIWKTLLWEMDDRVLDELKYDYKSIVEKIREGKAHEIHQCEHDFLTLCPKHNGDFSDPSDTISKTKQPFSDKPAEVRAFRFKTKYMEKIIIREFGLECAKIAGWFVE